MRLSAGGTGVNPFEFHFTVTKASIGLPVPGTGGFFGVRKDQ